MAQHDGRRGAHGAVLLGEPTTDHRLHTQEGKEPGRHLCGTDHLGLCQARDRHSRGIVEDADVLEHAILILVDEVLVRRQATSVEGRGPGHDTHQLALILEGQRLQQHAIDDAENGRRGADPQREREDGEGREPGSLAEHARAYPHVPTELLKETQTAGIAGFLAQRVDRTELDPCATPRLGLVETLAAKLGDKPFQVLAHLFVQLAVETVSRA